METIDDDIAARAIDFIERQQKAGKPFFVWVNFTHMHFRTHGKPESRGQAGRWMSEYADVMIDHDKNVGSVLEALDKLGIADNTFVMYSTDNGPHANSWPDGASTPFRSEKNTNWEGATGFRPWSAGRARSSQARCRTRSSHTSTGHPLAAIGGDPDVKEKLLKGYQIGEKAFKVHLDGYNLLPYLTGQTDKNPRDSFIYCNDDVSLWPCGTTTGSSCFSSSVPREP